MPHLAGHRTCQCQGGLAGLVDRRANRSRPPRGRTDERVVQALEKAITEQEQGSTRTASYYLWRTRQILADEYGPDAVPMPGGASRDPSRGLMAAAERRAGRDLGPGLSGRVCRLPG